LNYYSEKDIRDIVTGVLKSYSPVSQLQGKGLRTADGMEVPVEVSARHVHVTEEALNILFGDGYRLTPKRPLSQPGQFLAEEKVKLVTAKGQLVGVSILGPCRKAVQVELSITDARALGIPAPIRLSGDLDGAGDVILIGPKGVLYAKGSAIVAKEHVHMTPEDAKRYGVSDGESVSIRLNTERRVTLNDVIVRVSTKAKLAVHIDFDEANAAQVNHALNGYLIKNR
jgi:putative phosphotransacetylase